ncbi:right-handed parallel beta-helix repeat-containing protein [Pontiellaceae bacterium B12219]|nr:right-handed parallel beta-helix repeat-containing protein [Pontiellaceae bacterium B12219]
MNRYRIYLKWTAVAFFAVPSVLLARTVYVSPQGDDANAGTQTAPFASIAAARDALRASGKLGKESCEVIIGSGTYRFTEPLTLSPSDSGSKDAPAVYRAAEGAEVVFTGAQEINGSWEHWNDGIYRTEVGRMQAIDQLFVNHRRQIMARYPDLEAGYVLAENQKHQGGKAGNPPYEGCTPDAWDASKARGWSDPAGAFMHGMHGGLWGSQHYRVLGKKANGELLFEGGWQNNRYRSAHPSYRMIENIFEELDAPGEWYHDMKEGWLYYKPAAGIDMASAQFEAVLQIKHLVEFHGAHKQPVAVMEIPNSGNGLPMTTVKTYETTTAVKYIQFEGIHFAGTARTFMETIEPLLRSDWSIYRGGAVHLRGTEDITIANCSFEELGGNAVFIDGYNRRVVIRGNRFHNNGASDVNIVGSPAAVRDPAFSYGASARPLDTIDTEVGPKSDEYPADCLVEDNLMTHCGRFEKQVAGVNISMSSRITVRHNTISHTPRAAINVCDGTWGGHLIEWNDCFDTVLETHDHGAFNGWGRDQIWHNASPSGPTERDENGKPLISYYIEKYPNAPRWDAYQTSILRNNRMHCEHGWDIDLDDGCTNYELYNNLCLFGGLKTREGFYRIVTNNVIVGRLGYTCNVPYPKPTYDIFERNIIWAPTVYSSSNPGLWGGVRNHTFVHNPEATETGPAVALQKETFDDAESLYGNAAFVAPADGNFRVKAGSPALQTGFKNFPMTGFGVTSPELRKSAGTPPVKLPTKAASNRYRKVPAKEVCGAMVKSLDSEAELTATGMHERIGVFLINVPPDSELAAYGFKSDDVVLFVDGTSTPGLREFSRIFSKLKPGSHNAKVWRAQEPETFTFKK